MNFRQIGPYGIGEETPEVLRFDDGKMSSFYLVAGREAALLVDTGMAEAPLRPVIEQLTNKPVTLMITHGHGDHMRHMNEFDTVYMDQLDNTTLPAALRRAGLSFVPNLSAILPLREGQSISLGDISVQILTVGGHSPGSSVFYEANRHLLFTGDAVGSGCGVWMQLPDCLPLTQYRNNLSHLHEFWASLPKGVMVLPGHAGQRAMNPGGDNPVCLELVQDMITLCTLILEHREERQAAPALFVREISPAYYAEYGRASMVYTDQVIR